MANHKDVEYHVEVAESLEPTIFKNYDKACGHAVLLSMQQGKVYIDVVVWSRAGAKSIGLEEAYDMDPEASVLERIEVKTKSWGIVP